MPIYFDHPHFLWLLLLAVVIVWLGVRSLATLEPTRRWTAIALRLVVLAILVVILAGPAAQRWSDDLTVITVVDHSESVRRFAQPLDNSSSDQGGVVDPDQPVTIDDWLRDWVKQSSKDHEQDDRLGLVTFDGRPIVRALPSGDFELGPGTVDRPTQGTDLAAAVRLGMAMFPPDSGKRLVLISDGNDTASGDGADILAAAAEARAAGVPIDVLPVDYRVTNEVLVEGLYAPSESREGQTVALRAVLRATRPAEGTLYLEHDDQLVDLTAGDGRGILVQPHQWTLENMQDDPTGGPGNAAESQNTTQTPAETTNPSSPPDKDGQMYVWMKKIDLPLALVGTNRYELIFEPLEGNDTLVANNRAEAFTLVHGKGRVLFVDHLGPPSGQILPKALAEHGIDLDLVPAGGIPRRLDALQRYDAVILQNVPAETVSTKQQKMLARYVNDLGGGLVMIGGTDSFAAGGWTNSPIDQVLPVSCQIPSQTVLPSGALVLVLDRSGSMGASVSGSHYTQQELANEAAVLALGTLYPQDLIGVIAFDNSAKWIVDIQPNSDPAAVAKKIRSIHPGGGTNIFPALESAYIALGPLTTQDAAVKHVILLTDGQSQQGEFYRVVGQMVQAGITVSTVGVGDGVNSTLLAQLAQMSGGQYHPISDPNNLPQVFIKEARTIRKNVIKEQPFTPKLVATGSPIVSDFDGWPLLQGFVLTGMKNGAYTPLLGPEDEPIFAHWQVGLGRSAAFTSDATNRWAKAWLNWGGYSDFWARTVRAVARPSASREFDLTTTIEDETLRIRLDAASMDQSGGGRSTSASFVNFLNVAGTVLDPNGDAQQVMLQQTGPGIYEAQVPAERTGNYVVSLFVDNPQGSRQGSDGRRFIFGGASRPPGEELRRFRSNRAVLEQVAAITGGRVLDPLRQDPGTLFNRQSVSPTRSIRPLWRPLMMVLLVVFLLDVAARRIAWDFAAMGRWAADRYAVMGQWLKPRQVEAAATLETLKKRASEVEERLVASAVDQAAPVTPWADQKFEAAPDAVAENDLASAIGAATETQGQTPQPQESRDRADEDEGPTTGRLLDAKRRARQRMDTSPEP